MIPFPVRGFFVFLFLTSSIGQATPLTLWCQRVETTPVIDGAHQEPGWLDALPLEDGSFILKGLLYKKNLILGVKARHATISLTDLGNSPWPEIPEAEHRPRITIVALHKKRGIEHQTSIAVNGTLEDRMGWQDAAQEWQYDPTWSSNVKIRSPRRDDDWTMELSVPYTPDTEISIRFTDPSTPSRAPLIWHPVAVTHRALDPLLLHTLADDQLLEQADLQSHETASLVPIGLTLVGAYQEIMELLRQPQVTQEQFAERTRAWAHTLKYGEGIEGYDKLLEDGIARTFKAKARLKGFQKEIDKSYTMERALLSAGSLADFRQEVSSKLGDDALENDAPSAVRPAFASFGSENIPVGEFPEELPNTWNAVSEDQFRTMQHYALRRFTPAGREYQTRKFKELLKILAPKQGAKKKP